MGHTSAVTGLRMAERLTSAKAAKTCTRYISNSSQMPWYTKGAGCRHLHGITKRLAFLLQGQGSCSCSHHLTSVCLCTQVGYKVWHAFVCWLETLAPWNGATAHACFRTSTSFTALL